MIFATKVENPPLFCPYCGKQNISIHESEAILINEFVNITNHYICDQCCKTFIEEKAIPSKE